MLALLASIFKTPSFTRISAERTGLEPFINQTIEIVCKCIASALQMLEYRGFVILQTKIK